MKFVVFFVTFAAIATISCYAEEFRCIPGVPYIENRCNTCVCTETEVLGCTQMLCPNVPKEQHTVGDTWDEYCNKCWFDGQLGTVCTNNKCEALL